VPVIVSEDAVYLIKNPLKRKHIKELVQFYKEVFGCSCQGCAWHTGPCNVHIASLLEFHHRDRTEKWSVAEHRRISIYKSAIPYYNFAKAFEEVKKCDILCANCHRCVV
jgi:hypothetical protein